MPASIFELFRAGVPWMNQGDIESHILESKNMLGRITLQETHIFSHVKISSPPSSTVLPTIVCGITKHRRHTKIRRDDNWIANDLRE